MVNKSSRKCVKLNVRITKKGRKYSVSFCSDSSLPSLNCIASREDHCGPACTEGSKEEFEQKLTKVTKLRRFLQAYRRDWDTYTFVSFVAFCVPFASWLHRLKYQSPPIRIHTEEHKDHKEIHPISLLSLRLPKPLNYAPTLRWV